MRTAASRVGRNALFCPLEGRGDAGLLALAPVYLEVYTCP